MCSHIKYLCEHLGQDLKYTANAKVNEVHDFVGEVTVKNTELRPDWNIHVE